MRVESVKYQLSINAGLHLSSLLRRPLEQLSDFLHLLLHSYSVAALPRPMTEIYRIIAIHHS
jgi:hypothetical protein